MFYLEFLNCIIMNSQNSALPSDAKLKLTIPDTFVHHFQEKKKERLAEGSCRIYTTEITDETPNNNRTYFLTVKNFITEIENNTIFIRINYPQNTSYLFEKQILGLCAISLNKAKGYQEFDKLFSEFAVILDFNSENINQNLKQKIQMHCPDNIQTKDITNDAKTLFKKVGKSIGLVVGKASSLVTKSTSVAASSISERADRISRQSISQQTKTKWNNVKQKSNNVNESLSQFMRPLINKYRSIQDSIAQTFKNSDNKVIKTVREYGEAFSSSINQGQKLSHVEQPVVMKDEESRYDLK